MFGIMRIDFCRESQSLDCFSLLIQLHGLFCHEAGLCDEHAVLPVPDFNKHVGEYRDYCKGDCADGNDDPVPPSDGLVLGFEPFRLLL